MIGSACSLDVLHRYAHLLALGILFIWTFPRSILRDGFEVPMDFHELTFRKIFQGLQLILIVFRRGFLAGGLCPCDLRSHRVATVLGLKVRHRMGYLLGLIFTPSVISKDWVGSRYGVLFYQRKRRTFQALILLLGWLWRLLLFQRGIVGRFF